MFGLFRRKVNTQDVKAFESAVNAINIYVALSDWKKAKMAAHEIIYKEKKSLENLIQNNNWDKKFEKKNIAIFEKKEEKIKKLLAKIELLEKDYNDKLKIERFNVRIKSIKKEIDKLISQSKTNDALSLLNSFYKENENIDSVVIYENNVISYLEELKSNNKVSSDKILEIFSQLYDKENITKRIRKRDAVNYKILFDEILNNVL